MRKRRHLLAWLLTLCLCVGVLTPTAAAGSDLYFTSVNDTLLPLTAETMPYRSGGIMYVPYTVFDGSASGVPLGISCLYNQSRNTLILYNNSQVLTFFLDTGVCYDEMTGDRYNKRAAMHDGIPFVALDTVCLFFGLKYTYSLVPGIDNAYLVRVTDSAVILSDAKFLDAASNLIARRYQSYLQSLPAPEPEDLPALPPSSGGEEPEKKPEDVTTYLAILCEDGGDIPAMLDALEETGVYALFFVTPELLDREDCRIRQIMGGGHRVGIWAEGKDALDVRSILDEGSRMMEALFYTRPQLACVPERQKKALEVEGWVCWDEDMRLEPSGTVGAFAYSDRIVNQLEGRSEAVHLTLCGEDAGRILPALLRRLREERFVVTAPLETLL